MLVPATPEESSATRHLFSQESRTKVYGKGGKLILSTDGKRLSAELISSIKKPASTQAKD